MKLRVVCHDEKRETLEIELADTATLDDLRRRIDPEMALFVHLSRNRKDELFGHWPMYTLGSLGVTSSEIIYYSLNRSAFAASRDYLFNWKLGGYETRDSESEKIHQITGKDIKLRLRCHERRETLEIELPDTASLDDLRGRVDPMMAPFVHLSRNRKDELLPRWPMDTLGSMGVKSGDVIYYSLNPSAFAASRMILHDGMGVRFAGANIALD